MTQGIREKDVIADDVDTDITSGLLKSVYLRTDREALDSEMMGTQER
jgi:hypothetical protein